MLTRLLLLVLALVVSGCGEAPASVPKRTMSDRRAQAELLARQPPGQTSHQLRSGELVVLDVPVVIGPGLTDVQKCFLFRDAEYKTASLSCPVEGNGALPPGGPTADAHNP